MPWAGAGRHLHRRAAPDDPTCTARTEPQPIANRLLTLCIRVVPTLVLSTNAECIAMSPNPNSLLSPFSSPRPVSPRRSPWRMAAATLSFSITLALTGCSTPMLHSTVDVPDHFTEVGADEAAGQPEVAWWKSYGDPVLTGLIERAARENRDVRIAAEHV